jgi:transposase, IS5 family
MNHALVKLAQAIDWRFLEKRFGAVYTDKPGQPLLPTRLMAGLAILKTFPTRLCATAGWTARFQYFCGEEFFRHAVVFDRSSLQADRARERLVRLAKKLGVSLRQSYRRVGKLALIKH